MNAVRALLKDRKRSQRGSVLSGVLIIVAFISIIAGALMTELTGTFLVSRALVNRVNNEATVNSAVELAINQLQGRQLGSPCPSLNPLTLNGNTAVVSYLNCAADSRFNPPFTGIASGSPFTTDGTRAVLPSPWNVDEYLVSDVNGKVSAFRFGQSVPIWTFGVEGILTGPPTAMADTANEPGIIDLVPVTDPDDGNVDPNCGIHGFCVAVLTQGSSSQPPQLMCFIQADARVSAPVAPGRDFQDLAYFGDASGRVYAYSPTRGNNDNGCTLIDTATVPGGQGIVAGPVVFPDPRGHSAIDHIYAVTSDGTSSRLVQFTYTQGGDSGPALSYASSLSLPWPDAQGLALESSNLPTRLAITFGGGGVVIVQLQSGFGMSLVASSSVPSGIADAPSWCNCPSGDLIGIGGQNGALYVLDSALNVYGTYPAGGPAINTTPGADGAGDWFFGADDGYLYEVQRPANHSTMTLATRFGPLVGRIGSSPLVGGCPTGICIYLGTRNSSAYLVRLDTRDTILTACLSGAPPACSGDNPRLWVHVQVGEVGDNQAVHVSGWSYYSP